MRYRKSISYAPLLRKCKSRFWWPNPGLSHFSKILSKTLIFLKLRGAGKFTSWFFDVLGPTHHPVSKLKNDTIFLSILILDLLLIELIQKSIGPQNEIDVPQNPNELTPFQLDQVRNEIRKMNVAKQQLVSSDFAKIDGDF